MTNEYNMARYERAERKRRVRRMRNLWCAVCGGFGLERQEQEMHAVKKGVSPLVDHQATRARSMGMRRWA